LENYSCKMVSEEKRQYKDLVSRLESNAEDKSSLRLSPSRTIRGLRELTGQPIARSSYQMSTCQVKLPLVAFSTHFLAPFHLLANFADINRSTSFPTSREDSTSSHGRHNSETASSSEDGVLTPPSESSRLSITAKELFCLMSTLNLSFGPSYDFLTADSEEFCLEPELWVVQHYISRFCSIYVDKYESLAPKLWKAIEEAIVSQECIIYSYRPDHASDPYSSGCLASFNYFFYNRDIKRILFFSLRVLKYDPSSLPRSAFASFFFFFT
uniref:Repressor of RNA polymerase III transcription MAF1 homolog n=1 Tax=Schistocephalus solidus TaxID=70667 RepID=A0A183T3R9_SCHSO